MIKILDGKKDGREVVRISVREEEDFKSNVGKTASFIIRALAVENKEVYVKFISSTKKLPEISLKCQKMLIILNKMISEGLDVVFDDSLPPKFRGKKMTILASLPYVKTTDVYRIVKNDDGTFEKEKADIEEGFEPKATIIKLYLAEETE